MKRPFRRSRSRPAFENLLYYPFVSAWFCCGENAGKAVAEKNGASVSRGVISQGLGLQ